MKKNPSRNSAFFRTRLLLATLLSAGAGLLAVTALGLYPINTASAQKTAASEKAKVAGSADPVGMRAVKLYHNDESAPLHDLALMPIAPQGREREGEGNENPKIPHQHQDGADPVVQRSLLAQIAPNIPAPILNFDGIGFPGVACNCAPPDTVGEVGATQFVQMVNEGYQVFNKTTGASVLGPVGIQTIWAGFGGVCETSGSGDPVVMYDQLANRWVITQFAGTSVPTDECIAISKTSDATGAYYRYAFHLGSNFFDYPHLGVWPDGYYMAMNVFNSGGTAFLGPQAFAFDRAAMLIGAPATFVTPGITGGASEETFLPSDLDGHLPPPAGAPNAFVQWPSAGAHKVFKFHADFATPANSTFTLATSVPAAAFTEMCPTTRACVPQSGSAANLDAIGDRLMYRLAYRRFADGHESLVGNYTVNSSGIASPRWFEMRNITSGTPSLFQQSTYQPDTTHRWMASAAMDNQGNLAIGFSASSSQIRPEIRYAGRLVGDPLNSLAQGEATLFAGAGSQTGTGNRWGDYSNLTVDPVDDCTFWHTNEYYATTTTFAWRTRIGSFKFAQCTAPPKGTGHFTVTSCAGGAALGDARILIDGILYGASDSVSGLYDASLAPGMHTYAISKPPIYGTPVTGNFVIADTQTTNVNVCLVGSPLITSGASSLVAESCTPPNSAIDPGETVTVSLCVSNTGGADSANLVGTLQATGGVTNQSGPQNYGVVAAGGPPVCRNFTFTASGSLACGNNVVATIQLQDGVNNLGTAVYNFQTGTVVTSFSENFDGAVAPALPAGWTTSATGIGVPWVTSTTTPFSAPNGAFAPDPSNIGNTELLSPTFAVPAGGATLTFKNNYNTEATFDGMVLEISINGGAYADIITAGGSFVTGGYTGPISTAFASPIAGRNAWNGNSGGYITSTVTLPPAANGQMTKLKWRMATDNSVAATGVRIDDITVSVRTCATSCSAAPTPVSVVSRKAHGAQGNFDINLPLSGASGVECRRGQGTGQNDHTIVVTFGGAPSVSGAPQATVTSGVGMIGSNGVPNGGMVTVSGNTVTIPLTGVSNAQVLTVTLNGVTVGAASGNVVIPMGVLLGDTNDSRSVNAGDALQTRGRSGQITDGTNFRSDVNPDGAIAAGDVIIVRGQAGNSIP